MANSSIEAARDVESPTRPNTAGSTAHSQLKTMILNANANVKLKPERFDYDLCFEPITQESDAKYRNSYTLNRIDDYRTQRGLIGYTLLGHFQEDFENWSEDDFKIIDPSLLSAIKNSLRFRGLYTGKFRGESTAKQLVKLLTVDALPEWPKQEFNESDFYL